MTESVGRAIIDAAVLLVGAYRDAELAPDAAESISRLLRLPRAQQLSLDGLDAEAVRSCLEGLSGQQVRP